MAQLNISNESKYEKWLHFNEYLFSEMCKKSELFFFSGSIKEASWREFLVDERFYIKPNSDD